jgi:Cysteine-rich secretory protein family
MKATFGLVAGLCALLGLFASAAHGEETTTTEAATQQARPLHRHATLFGMLQRNNSIRRRVGLFPHRISPTLTAAAQDHANYMARTGQFSHYTNGSPQSRAGKYGFRGGVRENIAMGTRTIDGAFNMWQNSGAHYASIVSGTAEAGFGYAVGPGGQVYWVGMYGTPPAGDSIGETEAQVAAAIEEGKKAAEQLAAEKTAAEKDPEVKPASATLDPEQKPASEVQPAAASESTAGK